MTGTSGYDNKWNPKGCCKLAHVPCVQGAIGADDKKSVLEIGRKSMDKSCQLYGNFHVETHNMIAGRRAYIAVQKSTFKVGTWSHRQANARC